MLDLQSLPALPNLDWQCVDNKEPQDLQPYAAYLNYYGIDFSSTMAGEGVQQYLGQLPLGGFDIAVHLFQPKKSRGTVLLCHGYMDHVGLYNHLIAALLQQGFQVLSYDLPGHGLSSGEQAGIANFYCYQKVLSALIAQGSRVLKGPWYMVGQSTGCSMLMDYLLSQPQHSFKKAVLLAPLVRPKRWQRIKMTLWLGRYLLTQVKRDFPINSGDAEFSHFLQYKDPLQTRFIKASWVNALYHWQQHFEQLGQAKVPILVIQGQADMTVQWEYNLPAIQQHFPNYQQYLLPQAKHHLVKESEVIREEIFAEMSGFLTSK